MAKKAIEKKPGRGGAREGAGRKPIAKRRKRRPFTVWLTPGEAAHLKRLAKSPAAGLQLLVAQSIEASKAAG